MTKSTVTIEPNEIPKGWVDSSYAVHPDMKSHASIYMTIYKGATYMASCIRKLKHQKLYRGQAGSLR